MKPSIKYAEFQAQRADVWLAKHAEFIALGMRAPLAANEVKYRISHWNDDPAKAFLELSYRAGGKWQTKMVRRGDPLLLELRSDANKTKD